MFVNQSGIMNILISYATLHITGSVEFTLLSVMLLFIILGLSFRLPLEVTFLICIPLIISFMAYESSMIQFGGIVLLVLGGILGLKWFFFK